MISDSGAKTGFKEKTFDSVIDRIIIIELA